MKFICVNCGNAYREKQFALDCNCIVDYKVVQYYTCSKCKREHECMSDAARCCKEVTEHEGELKFECIGCSAVYETKSEAQDCSCLLSFACYKCKELWETERHAINCCKEIREV